MEPCEDRDPAGACPLRPIRSDAELDQAIAAINALIDRDELTADETDYLDVLSDLVERYENEHVPIPPASEASMLRFLIESRGVTQAQAAADLGIAESTISDVLAGRRVLTRRRVTALARYFHVSPAVFLAEESEWRGWLSQGVRGTPIHSIPKDSGARRTPDKAQPRHSDEHGTGRRRERGRGDRTR